MKIKYQPYKSKSTVFEDIIQGDLFWFNGDLFMKLQNMGWGPHNMNATKLKDGSQHQFMRDWTCDPAQGQFVVDWWRP